MTALLKQQGTVKILRGHVGTVPENMLAKCEVRNIRHFNPLCVNNLNSVTHYLTSKWQDKKTRQDRII